MNLTIREAERLLTGLESLIINIEIIPSTYATEENKDFVEKLLDKQTEGLQELYRELSNYVSQKKATVQLEFNFEDYL